MWNKFTKKIGEHKFCYSTATRCWTKENDNTHYDLPSEDEEIVQWYIMKSQDQTIYDTIASCPGYKCSCE